MALSKPELPFFHAPCSVTVHPQTGDSHFGFALELFVNIFKGASKIYGPLYFFSALTNGKGPVYWVKRTIPSIIRSSLFLAVYGFLYGRVSCFIMSILKGNYRIAYFLGSYIGALVSILIEKPFRRIELAVYVMNQAAETTFRMLVTRGYMKPIKYGVVMLFSIGLAILTYFHKFERESLGSNINGLMKVFVGVEEERDFVEKRLHQAFSAVRDSAVRLFSRGKVQHASNGDKEGNFFTGRHKCCAHKCSCFEYTTVGLTKGFSIGYTFKSVLAIAPTLFNPKILTIQSKRRAALVKAFGRKSLEFGLFVALLSGLVRLVNCILRRVRGVEDGFNAIVSGLIAGTSTAIAKSVELSMYILAKAGEAVFRALVSHKYLPQLPHWEAILYALSTAILFYASTFEPFNLRPSYMAFLYRVSSGSFRNFFNSSKGLRDEFLTSWFPGMISPKLATF